jgi:GGDEF domain-containing protein
MIGASKPLAPLAGAAADTFQEITVKAGARAAGGYALGYGLARSQGASEDDAHAQGLMFAGMNLAGGKRAPEERLQPVDEAAHQAATSPRYETPLPSEAQIESGNYQKGHVQIAGLDLSIENPEGSKRKPEWPPLKAHYGYIRRSGPGADGEQLDVFVKPGTPEDYKGPVFVVDQLGKDGKFDEHKIMLGFSDEAAARKGYSENYTKGWKVGPVREFANPAEFKNWLDTADTTQPASGAESVPAGDRRADFQTRQRIADMSPDEMRRELLTSPKTGLPNERAYNEAPRKAVQVRSDLDGLKWVNDYLGHEAGDELIKAKGQALADEGIDAYHISGDEFYSQFDSPAAARESMARVQDRLKRATIEVTGPDGDVTEIKGTGFSYGIGENGQRAETALAADKQARAESGARSARGERPAGFEATNRGRQDQAWFQGQGEAAAPLIPNRAYGAENKLVTKDAATAALARIRQRGKTERGSGGPSTDELADWLTLATYHVEAGAREFGAFSSRMIADVGDWIKPHLSDLHDKAISLTGDHPVNDFVSSGRELYQKARGFADWSRQMIAEHGPAVKEHLADIWGKLETESDRMFKAGSKPLADDFDRHFATPADARPSSPAVLPPDESVYNAPDASGKTPALSVLDSYIRANILAGASPYSHKLGSLTISAVAEEAARPFAAVTDAIMGKVKGRRVMYEDLRGLGRAAASAVTKGIPESVEILRRGFTPEQIAQGNLPYEIKGRNPIVAAYINLVFRMYRGGVHPFGVFAYTRAQENQALALAKTEARAGKIAGGEIRARADEIVKGENVPDSVAGQMQNNSIMAAAEATFQRDNAVSRKWRAVRAAVGPGWGFAMNRAVEFTRTPVNAVIKTIELTPGLGQAKQLITDLAKLKKTGEWLPDDVDQARFAMAWGKLPVGVGLFMLGAHLHSRGLMTGIIDDPKKRSLMRAQGKGEGSLQIAPNTWLDVLRYSPVGAVMAMGATYDYLAHGQGVSKDEGTFKDAMHDLARSLVPAVETLPLAQNPGRIIDPKAQAAKLLPGYSTVRDVYRGNESTIGKAVPAAGWLFGRSAPDALGRRRADPGYLGTVLHVRKGEPSRVLDELDKHGVGIVPGKIGDTRKSGQLVESRLQMLVDSEAYSGLDQTMKKVALVDAMHRARAEYDEIRKGGKAQEPRAAEFNVSMRVSMLQARRQLTTDSEYKGLSKLEQDSADRRLSGLFRSATVRSADDIVDARETLREVNADLKDSIREIISDIKEARHQ